MTHSPQEKTLTTRAKRAVLFIALLLVAVFLSGLPVKAMRFDVISEAARDIAQSMDLSDETLGVQETPVFDCDETLLPEGFIDEVGVCENCMDVRTDEWEGGGVVGFIVRSPAQDAYAALRDQLIQKQWICADSGRENCGSFSKGKGLYRWLFVSCTGVEDAASVVVQYTNAAERG